MTTEAAPAHPSVAAMAKLEQVFTPGFSGNIRMPSRRLLKCSALPGEVKITDLADSELCFEAHQEDVGATEAKLPGVRYTIFSRDYETGYHHPDIFAARLFRRALQYLEAQHGAPLLRIVGMWSIEEGGSDNYTQYMAALQPYGSNPFYHHKREAARTTWTGKMAAAMGFTSVGAITEERPPSKDYIMVDFDRPTAGGLYCRRSVLPGF